MTCKSMTKLLKSPTTVQLTMMPTGVVNKQDVKMQQGAGIGGKLQPNKHMRYQQCRHMRIHEREALDHYLQEMLCFAHLTCHILGVACRSIGLEINKEISIMQLPA